jgi:hydroxymethylpyrimidine pyrophosphatase-like HAD family hydrolase
MANSIPAVLAEADVVTSSNDEDGVATFIERTFLKELK